MTRVKLGLIERTRRFLAEELWRFELRPHSFTAAVLRSLQLAVMVVVGFFRDKLLLRASALTFMATLSVIPVLVVALSIVKAIGVSENLAELAVNQLAAVSPQARAEILTLVEQADLTGLGPLGALILFLTTVLALRHAETTLNDIWGVRRGRSWTRKFADYLAVLIVAPLFTGVALALAATLESDPIVQALLAFPLFQIPYEFGLRYAPMLLLFFSFSFLYWFLPNTNVRIRSALLGGAVAALLFTMSQRLYVDFNVGAAKYSAVFGGFAALPLLLAWLYISFAIILLGAEASFAHQNLAQYRREAQGELPGPAEREAMGIRIAVEIAQAFCDRTPTWNADRLSESLDLPVRTVRDLLQLLENAGIVSACAGSDREGTFQLGAPAADISVADVLVALRGRRESTLAGQQRTSDAVQALLDEVEGSVASIAGKRSLADLLSRGPRPA
ncbi:MAG: YhjD/YihY/BrkB family envelope integrity protein [Myxococcota bacterium]